LPQRSTPLLLYEVNEIGCRQFLALCGVKKIGETEFLILYSFLSFWEYWGNEPKTKIRGKKEKRPMK